MNKTKVLLLNLSGAAKQFPSNLVTIGYDVIIHRGKDEKILETIKKNAPKAVVISIKTFDKVRLENLMREIREKSDVPIIFSSNGELKLEEIISSCPDGIVSTLSSNHEINIQIEMTIHKKVEENHLLLRSSMLESQIESSIDGILVTGSNGEVISANERMRTLWNVPKKIWASISHNQLLKFAIKQSKYPDEFMKKVGYLNDHPSKKSQGEIELKDGRYLDRYSCPLINKHGKSLGRVWYFRDISESKKAYRDSEDNRIAMLNAIPDMMFRISDEGVILDYKAKNDSELLAPVDQLLNKIVAESWSKERMEFHMGHLRKALKSKKSIHYEFEMNNLKGEFRHFEARMMKLADRKEVISIVRDTTDAKRAERALLRSEKNLTEAQRLAKMGDWYWNLKNDTFFWSDETYRLYGYKPNEIEIDFDFFLNHIHEDDREQAQKDIKNALQNKNSYKNQFRSLRKTGEIRVTDTRGEVILDENGEVVGMRGICWDISDRAVAEEAMMDSQLKWDSLVRHHPDTIVIIDNATKVQSINHIPALLKKHGFSRKKLTNESLFKLFMEEKEMERAVINSGKSRTTQSIHIKGRVSGTYYNCSITPLVKNDIVVGSICILMDITEKRESERKIQTSEDRYRNFIQYSKEGIWRMEFDERIGLNAPINKLANHVLYKGRVEECNDTLAKMYGYKKAEGMLGKRLVDFFGQVSPKEEQIALERTKFFVNNDFKVNNSISQEKDLKGNTIYISNSTVGVVRDDRLIRIWGIQRNVTEQIEAAIELQKAKDELESRVEERTAELQQRNRELDQFTYVVAHDLKAPLRAIGTLSDWLKTDTKDASQEVLKNVNLLQNRAKRLKLFIDGLLDYSKIGKTNLAKEKISISQLLEDTFSMYNSISENVRFRVDGKMPEIVNHPILINQIFNNLIGNAINHNDKKKKLIQINYEDDTTNYKFEIVDNGPGIPEKLRERVFIIFQTIRPKDETENTGIGLAVVKKILYELNGQIWIESNENGIGCKFVFTIPKMIQ
ncbi:MAG: PAS domain S-box protein [Cytophagales bacterium]|nr:PAS domain S-box protein [Cytophagales bacterium]